MKLVGKSGIIIMCVYRSLSKASTRNLWAFSCKHFLREKKKIGSLNGRKPSHVLVVNLGHLSCLHVYQIMSCKQDKIVKPYVVPDV